MAPPKGVFLPASTHLVGEKALAITLKPTLQTLLHMFPPVDTRSPVAVTQFVENKFNAMYPGCGLQWLDQLFAEVVAFFSGEHPEYAGIDVRYHDLEHPLQATTCIVMLLEGRHLAGLEPRVDARHFELAVSAALLHDV